MLMKTVRKTLALLMAVVLLLCGFAACGKKEAGSDDSSSQKASNDAVAAALAAEPAPESGCKALKYDMNVTLDTEKNTVSGYEDVTIKNTSGAPLRELYFRYYAPAISKKSAVTDVSPDYQLYKENENTTVIVDFADEPMQPEEERTLRLSFTTVVPKLDDRFGYHKEGKGKMYLLTFWAPQLAMYTDGKWNDSPYFDEGESTYNAMSDYTVTFTAPESYVIAASGTQTSNGGVTTITAPNVREVSIVACDYMTVETSSVDGVTLKMYRPDYDDYDTLYDVMAENAAAAISLYNDKIGSYIYTELDIVPGFIKAGGMEMPGLVIEALPEHMNSYEYYNAALTVAHEVGHQWFYCAVGNDQYNEPWLDESFAQYCHEYLYQSAAPEALKRADRLALEGEPDATCIPTFDEYYHDSYGVADKHYINLPCSEYTFSGYSDYVYTRGAEFLYRLQKAMGDDSFFEMLSQWYLGNRLQVARGSDFIKHVLQYNDTQAVKDLINDYLSDEYVK